MTEIEQKKKRDPLFAAAVLKLSFRLANNEQTPAFKFVYEGVLRDLKVEDQAVEQYLADNYEKVLKAARGKERGEE
ncbi:MAG: hypothetical protein HY901_29860 [Deltaproteobacteria bacterium]|nr:hypothetical protein [Deltaproteobacteria bacterium]